MLRVVVFLGALSGLSWPASAQSPSLQDIIRGVQDVHRAIECYSVSCKVTDRRTSMSANPDGSLGSSGESVLTFVAAYMADSLGRVRRDSTTVSLSAGATSPERVLAAFDGNSVRRLETMRKDAHHGRITTVKSLVYEGLDPLDALTQVRGEPLAKMATRRPLRLAGTEMRGGREVVLVESARASGKAPMQIVRRLWIDPDRFVIVKAAQCVRFHDDDPWLEYYSDEMFGHTRDSSGIWLPARMVRLQHGLPMKRGIPLMRLLHSEVQFEKWVINPHVSDSTFKVEFPTGTFVEDEVNGRKFRVESVTDDMISDHAALARMSRSRLVWTVVIVVLASLAGIAVLLVVLQRTRQRRHG